MSTVTIEGVVYNVILDGDGQLVYEPVPLDPDNESNLFFDENGSIISATDAVDTEFLIKAKQRTIVDVEKYCDTGTEFAIFQGDTTLPCVVLTGADGTGLPIDVTESGWLCELRLLNAARFQMLPTREVTDTLMFGTVNYFIAHITRDESERLYANNRFGTRYYFSVDISNTQSGYQYTTEFAFTMLPKRYATVNF